MLEAFFVRSFYHRHSMRFVKNSMLLPQNYQANIKLEHDKKMD